MPDALFEVMRLLDEAHVHFSLERTRPDTVRVTATFVGERTEIDVFEDGHVEISRFYGNEDIVGGIEILSKIIRANA